MNRQNRQVTCHHREGGYLLSFQAMASPCEVLIDTTNAKLALMVGQHVANETWRIEDKYSRYDPHSVCSTLNKNAGKVTNIDQETYLLLQFADQCYLMSDGLFDITSGALRRAWHFDGGDKLPSKHQVEAILPYVGWQQTSLTETQFYMKKNMEIDLGGLGKEYAVDKALQLASTLSDAPMLINFGGDLAVNKARHNNQAWQIGIEQQSFSADKSIIVTIKSGALATSGDARRFILNNGKRYSHILNVKTGWPVENPPNSITVAAPQCIQAGFLATLSLLQGHRAEQLLTEQNIEYWSIR